MVYSFIYGIYILLITLGTGIMVDKLLSSIWVSGKSSLSPFTAYCLGVIGIIFTASVTAYFHPVDEYLHLVYLLLLVSGLLFIYRDVQLTLKKWIQAGLEHKLWLIMIVLTYLFAISISSGLLRFWDSAIYHLPLIKWLNEYGIVPGLANLQDTLGLLSGWFYYCSFFEIFGFRENTFHVINSTALLGTFLFIGHLLGNLKEQIASAKDYLVVPLILYLFLSITFLPTYSPNIILVTLSFFVIYKILASLENKKVSAYSVGVLVLATTMCVYIKLSALPILLIVSYPVLRYVYGTISKSELKFFQIITPFLPGLVILFLLFGQNIILTGYLIYPISFLDLFDFDWKVPKKTVEVLFNHIKMFGFHPEYLDYGNVTPYSFSWFRSWIAYDHKFGTQVAKILFLLLPATSFLTYYLLRRKSFGEDKGSYTTFYVLLIGCVAIWFFTSPNPRFGVVWLMAANFFPLGLLLVSAASKRNLINRTCYVLGILSLAGFLVLFSIKSDVLNRTVGETRFLAYLLLDIYMPEYEQVSIADGTSVNIPKNTIPAWNIPLPSKSRRVRYRSNNEVPIVRRGKSLGDGFKPIK